MHAILQTLPDLIGELRGNEAREAVVFALWPAVVGEHLREFSVPVRLEEKTLFVVVPNREWRSEFQQHAGKIVYKLNAIMKKSIVERLNFVIDAAAVRSSAAKSASKSLEPSSIAVSSDVASAASQIADPELRANFLKAAAACIERRAAVK